MPAGQLELTDGPSADEPDHFHAYRELLATDNEQELVAGVLQDRQVQIGVDPVTGLPQFSPVPVAAVDAGRQRRDFRHVLRKICSGRHPRGSPRRPRS